MSVTTFDDAVKTVSLLKTSPTNDEKLTLYKYYKQATVGDVQGSQPWAVQVESRAKWDAWNSVKGTSTEDAKTQYIQIANDLIAKYGVNSV